MTPDKSPQGAQDEALPDLPMAWGWAQTFAGEDYPVLRGGHFSDGQSVYTAAQMRSYAESATRALHARVQEMERAVAAERKACAEHYLEIMRQAVAAEREACLRLAERRHLDSPSPVEQGWYQAACKSIAADIRARGAQGGSK